MELEKYSACMQKISTDTITRASRISLLILDVDGVLTDGGIYIDERGEESKKFYAQDGHGLMLVKNLGIEVAIISGRFSKAVEHRGKELGIKNIKYLQADILNLNKWYKILYFGIIFHISKKALAPTITLPSLKT